MSRLPPRSRLDALMREDRKKREEAAAALRVKPIVPAPVQSEALRIPPQSVKAAALPNPEAARSLTDSNAGRMFSAGWSPDPEAVPDPKAEARRDRLALQVLNHVPRAFEPDREVWQGKGYELAQKVRDELGADWTQTGKFTAALELACQRYKQKNGRPFTPKALREGLRQRDAWLQGVSRRQY